MIKIILDRMFGYEDVYDTYSSFYPKNIEDVIVENTFLGEINGL